MTTHEWLKEIAEDLQPGSGKLLPAILPEAIMDAWELVARVVGILPEELVEPVAAHFNLPVARLRMQETNPASLLPFRLAMQFNVLPLALDGNTLHIATSDPTDDTALDQLHRAANHHIVLEIQSPQWVEQAVARTYAAVANREAEHSIQLDAPPEEDAKFDPAIHFAHQLLRKALEQRASDIHFQPYLGGYLVRLRVDGVLVRLTTLPKALGGQLVRHFKGVGGMDISNALQPHDGHASVFLLGRRVDLRLSTVPNTHGERLVVRLLDQSRVFSLNKLGYSPVRIQTLRRLARLDSGLVLFVGPTGCGKTTALYGMMSSLNNMTRSIATLEDPVEYDVPGLSQVSISHEQGMTFASAMRAQLRQDPDILLVGEIRDEETAQAAARAALTGHLVLSTLHSASARFAVSRLMDLGLSAPVLGEILKAVVAQRLVRRFCPHCSHPVTLPYTQAEQLFFDITYEAPAKRAAGCAACLFTGYLGVIPIVEIYRPSPDERTQLLGGNPPAELWVADQPRSETGNPDDLGMELQLRDFVISGLTSAEEAGRTLGSGFWQALARHYKNMGWRESDLNDQALSARSDEEIGVVVLGRNPALATDLNQALAGSGFRAAYAGIRPTGKTMDFDYMGGLQKFHPNIGVMLVDLEGNDTDIAENLKMMRADFAWSGIPVVLLMPAESVILSDQLRLRMGKRLMQKPVAVQDIAQVIRSMGGHEL